MEEEDDDDIYAAEEEKMSGDAASLGHGGNPASDAKAENAKEEEEEGEEIEEDGSDSDIDIITERKEAPEGIVEPAPASHIKEAKAHTANIPASEPSPASRDSHAIKIEAPKRDTPPGRPGSSYPPIKTSTVDVDVKPVYRPIGKSILDVDMDTDFPEDDKPWRKPGTDMTDYFNYGFDEFTWASYCLKQQTLRKEVSDSKKQMEEMQNFLSNGMPPLPGMTGAPNTGAPPGISSMSAPNEIPPEMQQLFQQMMAQGLDPMSMGSEQMMQMMQGGALGEPNPNFAGQAFAQQGQGGHQMGYTGGFGAGGGSGGNQGGRGRGRRW